VAQDDRSSYDTRVAPKFAPPVVEADYCHRRCPWVEVRGTDRPAEQWRHAEDAKGIGRHPRPTEDLRHISADYDAVVRRHVSGNPKHLVKYAGLFLVIRKLRWADRCPMGRLVLLGILRHQHSQAMAVAIWKWIDHPAINHAEDRGRAAGAEGRGQHGHSCEARVLAKHAKGVAKAVEHRCEVSGVRCQTANS
jgi:hypothetical protein